MQTSAKSNLWFQSGYHKTEVETDTGRHVLYTLGHDRAAAHESLSFKHISEKANQTKINLSNYITMLRTWSQIIHCVGTSYDVLTLPFNAAERPAFSFHLLYISYNFRFIHQKDLECLGSNISVPKKGDMLIHSTGLIFGFSIYEY